MRSVSCIRTVKDLLSLVLSMQNNQRRSMECVSSSLLCLTRHLSIRKFSGRAYEANIIVVLMVPQTASSSSKLQVLALSFVLRPAPHHFVSADPSTLREDSRSRSVSSSLSDDHQKVGGEKPLFGESISIEESSEAPAKR